MRIARFLAAAAATVASIPLMAQQVNATAQQSASGSVAGMHADQSADAGAQANISRDHAGANTSAAGAANVEHPRGSANASSYAAEMAHMRPVTGELQGNLDAKSAHVGQQVVLKTTEKIRTADGTVIPRGSRLIGHVTQVQAHARGHEQSTLGIAFDRAELKGGQSFAIHSVIEAVRPSAAELDAASMAGQDTFAEPAASPVYAGGGARVVGGASSAVGGLGRAGSSLASNAGGALNAGGSAIDATGNVAGNTAGHLGRGVYGSTSAMSSLGTHATAFPGVMLNNSAAGEASGTFTAAKRNVRFNSGTQMVVGLAAAH